MRVSMPRGDIHYIVFSVLNDGELVNIDFDEIYFTVKKKYTDPSFLFQKKLSTGGIIKLDTGKYQIKIESADTINLPINKQGESYDLDIELNYQDIIKSTVCGNLIITKKVR